MLRERQSRISTVFYLCSMYNGLASRPSHNQQETRSFSSTLPHCADARTSCSICATWIRVIIYKMCPVTMNEREIICDRRASSRRFFYSLADPKTCLSSCLRPRMPCVSNNDDTRPHSVIVNVRGLAGCASHNFGSIAAGVTSVRCGWR
jgi:hypothetical protein